MKRIKVEAIRFSVLAGLFVGALAVAPYGCENMTPDQINATTQAITSVVTTTGQVVTPLVVNYENGQQVKVVRHRKPKPTATP